MNNGGGFPGGSVIKKKKSACQAENMGSIPGLGILYSGVLAWRVPWTEEIGMLQSMGLQRVRHNLAPKQWIVVYPLKSYLGNYWPEKIAYYSKCEMRKSGIWILYTIRS